MWIYNLQGTPQCRVDNQCFIGGVGCNKPVIQITDSYPNYTADAGITEAEQVPLDSQPNNTVFGALNNVDIEEFGND